VRSKKGENFVTEENNDNEEISKPTKTFVFFVAFCEKSSKSSQPNGTLATEMGTSVRIPVSG
jgi:hypothetical protein